MCVAQWYTYIYVCVYMCMYTSMLKSAADLFLLLKPSGSNQLACLALAHWIPTSKIPAGTVAKDPFLVDSSPLLKPSGSNQ